MARRNRKQEAVPLDATGGSPVTIGAQFRAAREEQGMAIEDVSRILRLRPTILREIENDDLRSFTHASYARMSLLSYARILGISEDEVRAWLPAKGEMSSGEFTYLDQLQNPEPAARREDFAEQRLPKRNPLEIILKIAAVLLLLFGGAYAYMFWHNLGRLQGGTNESTDAAPSVLPDPPQPLIEIETIVTSLPDTPLELAPLNSPTPFLEQDVLALDIQIAAEPTALPAETVAEEEFAGMELADEPEVRAALPLEAVINSQPGTSESSLSDENN